MFSITQDNAQLLSMIGAAIFVVTLIILPIALLTERSRAAIRSLCLVGLSCAVLMGGISGYLYLWHHYYR